MGGPRQEAGRAEDERAGASTAERGGNYDGGAVATRKGMVVRRDPRGNGYMARYEAAAGHGGVVGVREELVPWSSVVAIR